MKGRRLAILATIVTAAMLLGPFVHAQQFKLDNGWDAIHEYDLNENNTEILDYSISGTFEFVIKCNGNWTEVSNLTQSTSQDNLIQYAQDYDTGNFGYVRFNDGSETRKVVDCDDYDLKPVPLDQHKWVSGKACVGSPRTGETVATTPEGRAPDDQKTTTDAPDPTPGFCVHAQAESAEAANFPYTGTVKARFLKWNDKIIEEAFVTAVGGVRVDGGPTDDFAKPVECPCELHAHSFGPHSVGVGAGDYRAKLTS